MFIATIFFWAGRKKFVHIPPAGWGFVKQMFSKEGLGALGRLVIVYVFVAVFWSLWDQSSGGSWTLQARNMDLNFFGMQLLPAQVQTANPILILLFIPLVNYLIYPALDKVFALTPLRKIGIGLFLTAFSFFVIAYHPKHDRRGPASDHLVAISRLRDSDAGGDDGVDHRAGAFLHPGA